LLCRRLYGRNLAPKSKHLEDRIQEIESGKYNTEIDKLKKSDKNELKRLYQSRDIEAAY
jgi:hypothetical protein